MTWPPRKVPQHDRVAERGQAACRAGEDWSSLERRIAMLASFAAVAADLKERDAQHRLRDVQVSLAEDNQTVTVFSNWSDDAATLYSSFTLPEPVAVEDFDAGRWRKLLER